MRRSARVRQYGFAHTHGDIVEPVKVRQGLGVRLVLDELLRPAVKEADVLGDMSEWGHGMTSRGVRAPGPRGGSPRR
jgi:hypothetical protein